MQFWDVKSKALLSTLQGAFPGEADGGPMDSFRPDYSVLSSNGRWFAGRGKKNQTAAIFVWDTRDGKVSDLVGNPMERPAPVCFRPDDRVLAIHCGQAEEVVEFWDLTLRRRLATLPCPGSGKKKVWTSKGPPIRWSENGTRFIAIAEFENNRHAVAIYDFVQPNPTYWSERVVHALEFADDSRLVVNGDIWTVGGPAQQRFLRSSFTSQADRVFVDSNGAIYHAYLPQPHIDHRWNRHLASGPIKIVQVAPVRREWHLPRPVLTKSVCWFEVLQSVIGNRVSEKEYNAAFERLSATLVLGQSLHAGGSQNPYGMLGVHAFLNTDKDGIRPIGSRAVGPALELEPIAIRSFGISPNGMYASVLYQVRPRGAREATRVWKCGASTVPSPSSSGSCLFLIRNPARAKQRGSLRRREFGTTPVGLRVLKPCQFISVGTAGNSGSLVSDRQYLTS